MRPVLTILLLPPVIKSPLKFPKIMPPLKMEFPPVENATPASALPMMSPVFENTLAPPVDDHARVATEHMARAVEGEAVTARVELNAVAVRGLRHHVAIEQE